MQRGYWPVAIHISLFYAVCMICQTSSCSICFQKPGFNSPDWPSTSSSHIHRAVLIRQVICRVISLWEKRDGLVFFIVLLALSKLSVRAPVWSLLPLLMFCLWFVWNLSSRTYSHRTNSMTLKRRWSTPSDASAATVAHRLLSSAMHSSDDNDWPVNSLRLSLHVLRGPPLLRLSSTVCFP